MACAAPSDLVDELKADVRSKLLDLLHEVGGRKVLLVDSTILGPLGLVLDPSDLKDHGVQKWFRLSEQAVDTDCSQMIFLVRCARPELVGWIAHQILTDEAQGKDRVYVVVFVPRKTEQCIEQLGRGNVRANVRIAECALHFFPCDRDVLSMEVPGVFNDFHVNGDPSGVFYAAKALMYLQSKFGVIPSVHAIGGAGKNAVDILLRLRKEEQMSEALKNPRSWRELSQPGVPPVAPHTRRKEDGSGQPPRIHEVVVIDRRVDLFSVLCSQFTYQALIDTVYGVQNNATQVTAPEWKKDRNVRLPPDDPFYQEIRDLHIDKLGVLLQEKAQAIQKTYAEKDHLSGPHEMAEYVKKFKTAQAAHPLLELHINLAHNLMEVIKHEEYRALLRLEDDIAAQSANPSLDMIEDLVDDQKPFHEVMRMLCLHSLVNNGVKAKQLDQLKRSIIQAYGYEHLLTLCNMERVGILRYYQGKSVWPSIKQKFNLFVEDIAADRDISYAYSGYAPLSVRLVQMMRAPPKGWRSCQDALSLLYGPAQQLQQPTDHNTSTETADPSSPTVVLVFFIGGVTYGEIAALRRLSELEEGRRKFLIVTTEFTNAKKLFESLRCEQVFNAPPVEVTRKPKPAETRRGFGLWGSSSS